MPVGKAAPPRPRRPESDISLITSGGSISNKALFSAAYPFVGDVLAYVAGGYVPGVAEGDPLLELDAGERIEVWDVLNGGAAQVSDGLLPRDPVIH